MGLLAGTAGPKRQGSIAMKFSSRAISPVPDISRHGSRELGSGNTFQWEPCKSVEVTTGGAMCPAKPGLGM